MNTLQKSITVFFCFLCISSITQVNLFAPPKAGNNPRPRTGADVRREIEEADSLRNKNSHSARTAIIIETREELKKVLEELAAFYHSFSKEVKVMEELLSRMEDKETIRFGTRLVSPAAHIKVSKSYIKEIPGYLRTLHNLQGKKAEIPNWYSYTKLMQKQSENNCILIDAMRDQISSKELLSIRLDHPLKSTTAKAGSPVTQRRNLPRTLKPIMGTQTDSNTVSEHAS